MRVFSLVIEMNALNSIRLNMMSAWTKPIDLSMSMSGIGKRQSVGNIF